VDPALEGSFTAKLKNGKFVKVTTVFELVRSASKTTHREGLEDVRRRPERHARPGAQSGHKADDDYRFLGNASKIYHGDLVERAEILLWAHRQLGPQGTGVRAWLAALFDGYFVTAAKGAPGTEATKRVTDMIGTMVQAIKGMDPTMTDQMAMIELAKRAPALGSPAMVPPIFVWYYHSGFDKIWNRNEWHDPSMKRPFQEYWDEALEKGWWDGVVVPGRSRSPASSSRWAATLSAAPAVARTCS
jgi:hypothetical protein